MLQKESNQDSLFSRKFTFDEVDPWYDTGLFCLEVSLFILLLGGATGAPDSDSVSVATVSSIASSSKSSN